MWKKLGEILKWYQTRLHSLILTLGYFGYYILATCNLRYCVSGFLVHVSSSEEENLTDEMRQFGFLVRYLESSSSQRQRDK
jgi:hypothetical protein